MKKTMFLTVVLLAGSLASVWAQSMTKQQALDEIARIERFNAQVDEMLRQAWEAGRTQRETVIDTPYGKVTVKFNLAEIINSRYTGAERDEKLRDLAGEMSGSELRLNTSSNIFKEKDQEQIKWVITHELGHYMDRRPSRGPSLSGNMYRSHEDLTEIEADAFAMRHLDKFRGIGSISESRYYNNEFIDAVLKRAFEIEREERENLARLRNIAGLPSQPQNVRNAQSYIESGKAAYDKKDYSVAVRNFTLAIGLEPNNAEAYYRRAESRIVTYTRDAAAFADYRKALQLDPNNNTYKEALRKAEGNLSYLSSGKDAYNKRDYDKAIADFTEVIRFDPSVENYRLRADAYIGKKDYDNAIADYTEMIRLATNMDVFNRSVYYSLRAGAYKDKGDYDKAIADYTEAIRIYRQSHSYSYRADTYLVKKDYDKAIADYTEAIRINPNSSGFGWITERSLTGRASAYIGKKDYDKAIADCNEAIRLAPNSVAAYSGRAEAYIGKRKYKEARADVNEALRISPNDQKAKDLDAELKKRRQ
jgi:tetratricopeptide (TPR) repeat protein